MTHEALDETERVQPYFADIVDQVGRQIKHDGYRRIVGTFFKRRVEFYQVLPALQTEVLQGIADVQELFKTANDRTQPILTRLVSSIEEADMPPPSLEALLEQAYLSDHIKRLIRRRDTALALIEAPLTAALVGMNDATFMLIGQRSRFAFDLGELLGDLLETVSDLYVPGTGGLILILKQLRNRMRQSADEAAEALILAERLYIFGDYAEENLVALKNWHRSAMGAIDDLRQITKNDFPEFVDRLQAIAVPQPRGTAT